MIPWQFFFRLSGNVDLPLSFFIALTGFASVMLVKIDWPAAFRNMKGVVFSYSLLLGGIAVSSLLNSSSGLREAANVIGHLSTGFIVILWTGLILHSRPDFSLQKDIVVKAFLFSVFPLGLMGVFFFFYPELENSWLDLIGGILIEADSAMSTEYGITNIYRIGVIFMDVNAASIFWGTSMWLSLWVKKKSIGSWRHMYTIMAIVFLLDVLSTGSRTGILALVLTIVLSLIIRGSFSPDDKRKIIRMTAISVLPLISIFIFLAYFGKTPDSLNRLITRTESLLTFNLSGSDSDRIALFAHAIKKIKEKPLLGHGVDSFNNLGFPRGYPPHNMLLHVWIFGGLPAVTGLIWLFTNVVYLLFRQLKRDHDTWLPIVVISWIIIQAMLMNLIIANFRIAMILWLIVSLFLWSSHQGTNGSREKT